MGRRKIERYCISCQKLLFNRPLSTLRCKDCANKRRKQKLNKYGRDYYWRNKNGNKKMSDM